MLFLGQVAAPPVPPLSGGDVVMRILAVVVLIVINAFFVTAEFSIVSVRRSRINQLVSAGDVQAKTVQDLQRGLDRLLSTTQFGITLSSLALGWIGESTMAVLLSASFLQLPLPAGTRQFMAHSLAIPAAFILIAYLQIVLGELCPKSVALLYPEQLARFLGPASVAIARLFHPFIWILNQSTRWLLRIVGIQYTGQGWANRVTPEELQLIITSLTESPGLKADERELLSNVFSFGEVTAGEVIVPRTSLVAIPKEATVQDLMREVASSGYSRYPVMGESLDDIIGLIDFKDLAEPMANQALQLNQPIQPWLRPAQFVSEEMPLKELLSLMQRSGQTMVMVVDEFGGTAGLVTIQDVVAEIIGETHEPESPEEPNIRTLDDQTFLVQAQTDLEEVNETLSLELPLSEEYQTLGGFIIYQLQKIPTVGEQLLHGNCEMIVESAEGPRLERIQIRRIEPHSLPDLGTALLEPIEQTELSFEPLDDNPTQAEAGSEDALPSLRPGRSNLEAPDLETGLDTTTPPEPAPKPDPNKPAS